MSFLPVSTSANSAGRQRNASAAAEKETETHSVGGKSTRIPWTTSRVRGTPDPASAYRLRRVFPELQFRNLIALSSAPGVDRMFAAELDGRIFSFPLHSGESVRDPDLFFDLRRSLQLRSAQIYGFTFHPDYESNRWVYLCYIVRNGMPEGTRVSRFEVNEMNPPQILSETERIVITWPSGGHNGGCIKFGPDGALYISTGDGAGPNPPDTLNTGQDNTDLLSTILRIDVDTEEEGLGYRIPQDNPFLQRDDFRPEIWAYGFRNPWKMSFDRLSGDLWVGDVGWELWELIHRVERGGNYGWSAFEGRHPVRRDLEIGPTPVIHPLAEHSHSEAASITGGFVYRGSELPELYGAYVYGDYETGKIWGLRQSNNQVTWHQELLDARIHIVGFGEDPSGELYIAAHKKGDMYRLEPNPDSGLGHDFPHRLSETGLFSSVADHSPAPGVVPYQINAELWADGADSERWIAVPGNKTVRQNRREWSFPENTVFLKTLSLPDSGRRVETQLLHYEKGNWNAYAYLWNDEQDDAQLVDESGAQVQLKIQKTDSPDSIHVWNTSSRSECLRCHNSWRKGVLSFRPEQLTMPTASSDKRESEMQRLRDMKLFSGAPSRRPVKALVNPCNPEADLTARARSYLHANCAHCHSRNAGGSVPSLMTYHLHPEKMHMMEEVPRQGSFGIQDARVIAKGDPFRSVLYYRISKIGRSRMPHLASYRVDREGVELIYRWIRNLGSPGLEDSFEFSARNFREKGLVTTSDALRYLRAVDRGLLTPEFAGKVVDAGSRHDAIPIRELFDRFLPEEKRSKLLGSRINPDDILRLAGNSDRGRDLFFASDGMQCQACHQVNGKGRFIGPDLSKIGSRYTRELILESILNPSALIAPEFQSYLIETKDDELYSGFIVKRTESGVVMRDAVSQIIEIPSNRISSMDAQTVSLMPEQLLRDVTAQDAADLIAYLSVLK